MCGVIVVDASRSRSTNVGRDAYKHDHCLGYCHNYLLFYQLPNSNLFTRRMLFSREKPLVKSTAPGSILYHIWILIYYLPLLFLVLLFQKPKNTLLQFFLTYFILCFCKIYLSNLPQFNLSFYHRGINNPSFASSCKYLFFVCRYRLHSVAWFSYWLDNLDRITEGNTYRSCVASSLPLRGNTDADTSH